MARCSLRYCSKSCRRGRIYSFSCGGIDLVLTFFTPALPHRSGRALATPDLSRVEGHRIRRQGSRVAVYFDAASDLVVNTADQPVTFGRYLLDGADRSANGLAGSSPCLPNMETIFGSTGVILYLARRQTGGRFRRDSAASARAARHLRPKRPRAGFRRFLGARNRAGAAQPRCWRSPSIGGKSVQAVRFFPLPDARVRRSLFPSNSSNAGSGPGGAATAQRQPDLLRSARKEHDHTARAKHHVR